MTPADLSYGELAVALAASDMPTRWLPGCPLSQLTAWAAQGLARLGRDRIRRAAGMTRQFSYRYDYEPGALTPAERAAYRALWPSRRRRTTAHNHAYTIIFERTRTPHPNRTPSAPRCAPVPPYPYRAPLPHPEVHPS